MMIVCYAPAGFEGEIVDVEVDLRRSIPGIDIVGLPDVAVKEAKERVRVAVKNCGYVFPMERILVNLAPAGVRKEGAAFDLAIATAILNAANGTNSVLNRNESQVLVLGELELSGRIRPVSGVLPAVASATESGVGYIIVPTENVEEAVSLGEGQVFGVSNLKEAVTLITHLASGKLFDFPAPSTHSTFSPTSPSDLLDFSDMKGQNQVKRALEVAVAGSHHAFLFGPPGSGKTMAALRVPSIMPLLSREESIAVTKVYSLAGKLSKNGGLILHPPFRNPHHTASSEGIIGGGKPVIPGEISLAHHGVLFLDEAPEFHKNLLQSLREPVERGRVDIARAGFTYWFPARFQLLLAANPCPCGNLGKDDAVCVCSLAEIRRYWRRLGGALLDRIDIRIPVKPVDVDTILHDTPEPSKRIRERIEEAVRIQQARFRNYSICRNNQISPAQIAEFCTLRGEAEEMFSKAIKRLSLSSRACHSVLRIARTVADLEQSKEIEKIHVLEAVQHRRYGDGDYFWEQEP